tara:strand:- start:40 stop:378 length:339 start_codon:yes stop_codon:yes gene_type:complete
MRVKRPDELTLEEKEEIVYDNLPSPVKESVTIRKLQSKATKIEVKWGNTVYETIGVAYYTHYYYDNLRDFQDAYNLAKSAEFDLTGNLDSFRLVIKERRTLDDYVKYKEEEE